MSLGTGTRLGPYEILSPIGAGGMGEVYSARDTRLNRTVAIKVLPDLFAADLDRLARFDREAQTLAQLNHPNIAQIYGVETFSTDRGPLHALAMEFVDGEDLADRIHTGPIPVDEALRIARQIVDALDAAHQLHIIHRDLKPTNIRIREDGTVKVLDFGLAKALEPASLDTSHGDISTATLSSPAMTRAGVILGTAAYMSPEQARGKAVDRRADIWAFGVVLYEMVTGSRPFWGDTISDTIAAVLKTEPDWTPVPTELHPLLQTCLQKEPRNRLRDIGDVRLLIDRPAAPSTPGPGKRWLLFGAVVAAAAALVAALGASVFYARRPPLPRDVVTLQMLPPDESNFELGFALSPDGRSLAFAARGKDGVVRLWVRAMEAVTARQIPGTENGRSPKWSPDGRFLVFAVDRRLKKVDLTGNAPLTLCEVEAPNALGSGMWTPDGSTFVFGGFRAGALRKVSAVGGLVSPVTVLDDSRQDLAHGLPSMLPDGKHFVYLRVSRDAAMTGTYLGSLDTAPEAQSTTPLLKGDRGAVFTSAPNGNGYLLFLREGTLVAQPFDLDRLALAGEPQPVAQRVASQGALGLFAVSDRGVLAYRTGDTVQAGIRGQLTWLDSTGKQAGRVGDPGLYESVFLSPDLSRVAVTQPTIENPDIILFDVERGLPVRFTSGLEVDNNPLWSRDGHDIVYRSSSGNQVGFRRKRTDGTGEHEVLLVSPGAKQATDLRSDVLLYTALDATTRNDIWLLPLTGERHPVEVLRTPFNEGSASLSPDGRWLVYASDETGRIEVYVRAFERTPSGQVRLGGKIPVSKDGGSSPRWRREGRQLLFTGEGQMLMSVEVTAAPALRLDPAKPLFPLPPGVSQWDVSRDGTRFLVAVPITADTNRAPITVVLNWDVALP